jgi:plasmid stability protein
MWDDADHFRSRAKECRRLAENARSPEDRRMLVEMAKDLEDEAERIAKEGT